MNVSPPAESAGLIDRLTHHAATNANGIACADASRTLRFADLLTQTRAVASHLSSRGGPGSTLLIRTSNECAFYPWFLGALWAGWWAMPLPRTFPDHELTSLASRIQPVAIIDARDMCPHPTTSVPPPSREGGLLLTTSGSTDRPKIVRRSARSLDAVSRNMVEAIGLHAESHVACAIPITHSYGIEHGLLAPLWAGSRVTLIQGLDINVIANVLSNGVDLLPAVPAMVEQLAQRDGVRAPACIYSAGAPLPETIATAYTARFGRRVGQLYGMTEVGSVTFQSPSADDFDPRSVGWPMAGVTLRVDADTSELSLAAPSMFDGYLDDNVKLHDGHFDTGDLARVDASGRLFITGRSRLLIESAGRKINPLEIEAVLETHPKVGACVVVALRQTDTVQRLRAIIEPARPDDPPTDAELRTHAQSRLAGYKVPRLFECRDRLPRSLTGKVLRRELEQS